jgi:hypothetical protein
MPLILVDTIEREVVVKWPTKTGHKEYKLTAEYRILGKDEHAELSKKVMQRITGQDDDKHEMTSDEFNQFMLAMLDELVVGVSGLADNDGKEIDPVTGKDFAVKNPIIHPALWREFHKFRNLNAPDTGAKS